jgi:lipoprotein signal peptidase
MTRLVISVVLLVIDLAFKYQAVALNHAVINYGVSGGVSIPLPLLYLGYIVLGLWLLRERAWVILMGGLANFISRVWWGGVVDYWNFLGLFTNNLADWMIVIGLVLYLSEVKRVQYES